MDRRSAAGFRDGAPVVGAGARAGRNWNEAQTEQEFVKPVLDALGWSYIVQVKAQRRGGSLTRPDYALFADPAAKELAYPDQGNDDAFYGRAAAIAEAKYWGRPLSQQDSFGPQHLEGREQPQPPDGQLPGGHTLPVGHPHQRPHLAPLQPGGQQHRQRVLRDRPGADLRFPRSGRRLPHPSKPADFKRWWLFFRRDAFLPDAHGRSFVQRVREGSATYAKRVSDKLKELVFDEVMPEIANGFVAYRREQLGIREETEESLREIYAAGLSLLYKLLFVLYAEARDLLPMRNPGYREQSLTSLAEWAAERIDRRLPLSDDHFRHAALRGVAGPLPAHRPRRPQPGHPALRRRAVQRGHAREPVPGAP